MSAHQSHTWRCPRRGLTGGVTWPVQHRQLVNPHGKRARRLLWARYHNASVRGLRTARIPDWALPRKELRWRQAWAALGPKPLPQGPSSSRAKPGVPANPSKPVPVPSGKSRQV